MSFEKDNYVVVRKVLSKSWCNFFMTYYDLKRLCLKTLSERREISPFDAQYGYWGDQQVTNTYATYGDLNGETLLLKFKPILEKHTHLKLIENNSYMRIYKEGDELKFHMDREACKISSSLNLGGDKKWPLIIGSKHIHLDPGDMVIYKGSKVPHGRKAYEGKNYYQMFFHYNNEADRNIKKFDRRLHVGLPEYMRGKYGD